MPSRNAHDRALIARIGAHALHAAGKTNTAPGRQAFRKRFEHQVDPDGVLPADERERRAQHALEAHMTRLALASAQARRNKRGAS